MTDTGEIINDCIQHKDIRHLRLYCDYMQLYKYNEHKAKLVRILETWTNSKRAEWYRNAIAQKEQGQTPPEPDFWITMSYQQFRHFLYETASVDTIKKSITDLVEKDKHLQRRVNPENPYGPPQYLLNVTTIQKALNKQAATPFIPEVPDLESTPPPGESTPPMETNPSPRGANNPLAGGENTPTLGGKSVTSNNSTNNTSNNNENIYVNASALTHTPSQENEHAYPQENSSSQQKQASTVDNSQSSEQFRIATTEQGDTTHGRDNQHLVGTTRHPHVPDITSHRDAPDVLDDESHHGHTSEHPAPPQGQTALVGVPIGNAASLVEGVPQAATMANTGTASQAHLGMDIPSQAGVAMSSTNKGKGKPAPPKEEIPALPKTAPVEPHAGMQWGTRKCMQWFDYWRGGLLIGKYKLTQASTCAKGLAEQFSEEQVKQARSDMTEDPYWIARGGCDICDVANNIHRYLNKKLKPTSQANGEKPRAAVLLPEHIANERKRKLLESTAAQRAEMDARQAARQAKAIGE